MVKIELNPNDVQDLLEILEYAKKQCEINMPTDKRKRWNDLRYYIIRIEQLKELLKGKDKSVIYRSNFNI